MSNNSSKSHFPQFFSRKLYVLPVSKAEAQITHHFFRFFCSVTQLLSMGVVLQSSVWFSKKHGVKMMVQGSYWVALILHPVGCLWKWLEWRTLLRVSSTKYNSAEDCAGSDTQWSPRQDMLRQIQQKLSFKWNLLFTFSDMEDFIWGGCRQKSLYTQSQISSEMCFSIP